MRIYMQLGMTDNKPPKFCSLHLQEDLLGGWSLVRESGIQGSYGKVVKMHYGDHQSALEALVEVRGAYIDKGFRVVFAQGESQG